MPNRLRKVRIKHISLVDRPAEPDAVVVLAKRDYSEDIEKCDHEKGEDGKCKHCGKVMKASPDSQSVHTDKPMGKDDKKKSRARLMIDGDEEEPDEEDQDEESEGEEEEEPLPVKGRKKVSKHLQGQHDQQAHGAGRGGGTKRKAFEGMPKAHAGTHARNLEAEYWEIQSGARPDDQAVMRRKREIEDELDSLGELDRVIHRKTRGRKLTHGGLGTDYGTPESDAALRRRKTVVKQEATTPDSPLATLPFSTKESTMPDIANGDWTGIPEDVKEYVEGLEDRVIQLQDGLAKAEQALAKSGPEDEDDEGEGDDAILKSASPEVVALVKSLQAKVDEANEIAKAERDARLTREFRERAAKLSGIGMPTSELADLLKSLSETDAETYTKVESVLSKASEAVNKSALFSEAGTVGSTGDAEQKLQGIAKSLQDSDASLTAEQAFDMAMRRNPGLYREYLSETGA